jgi:hypothetical protein
MQTIGRLWWVWLAGMLLCWGYAWLYSFTHPTAAATNVLVGIRYLGFVFLVFLVFAMAVLLITRAAA